MIISSGDVFGPFLKIVFGLFQGRSGAGQSIMEKKIQYGEMLIRAIQCVLCN